MFDGHDHWGKRLVSSHETTAVIAVSIGVVPTEADASGGPSPVRGLVAAISLIWTHGTFLPYRCPSAEVPFLEINGFQRWMRQEYGSFRQRYPQSDNDDDDAVCVSSLKVAAGW